MRDQQNPTDNSTMAAKGGPSSPLAIYSRQSLFPEQLRSLINHLHLLSEDTRQSLLHHRKERQALYDMGQVPQFETHHPAKTTDWKVAPIPQDLLDRRVEITGPISNTKMVINMLSANQDGERACTAMLDFEDSMAPTWDNVVAGIENIIGVSHKNLTYEQANADGT
ncbi:MAG: hypothetical protein AAGB31_04195, partial [Bdellovibrio sp.]